MAIKFKLSYIPNAICIFRIILVIPIVVYLANEKYLYSLLLIALAGISDFFDGICDEEIVCNLLDLENFKLGL